jgi:hypothetical protein
MSRLSRPGKSVSAINPSAIRRNNWRSIGFFLLRRRLEPKSVLRAVDQPASGTDVKVVDLHLLLVRNVIHLPSDIPHELADRACINPSHSQ